MNRFAELHWAEGVFLQPQHFQLWQRHLAGTIHRSASAFQPFAWGVRELQIDEAALEAFIVSVTRCNVVLPDGTEVCVPDNADLPSLEIQERLDKEPGKPLEVRLGVPLTRERGGNLAPEARDADGLPRRYRLDTVDVSDENTGDNSRSLDVRRLNARLYLPGEEAIEFSSTIPILRVVRTREDESSPILDRNFVPPTLELQGSARLQEIAREVLHRATARANSLAEIINTQRIDFAVEAGGSPEIMLKMHVLNGFLAFYEQFLQVPRLHPVSVYCELCRFAGELAIFTESRRPPAIPPYSHGPAAEQDGDAVGLGACFSRLFEVIDDLLRQMYIARVRPTHFKPWGRFLLATLNPEWFDDRNSFYIAVDSHLGHEEVIHAMERQVSIASKQTIEEVARLVLPGIRRHVEHRTPMALPERAQRVYFQLDRRGGDEDLTVGTEELAIFNGSGKEFEFSLYVVTGKDKGQYPI